MASPQANDSPPKAVTTPVLRGEIILSGLNIPIQTMLLLDQESASKYRAIIFQDRLDRKTRRRTLSVAVEDPSSPQSVEFFKYLQDSNNVSLEVYQTTPQEIDAQLARYLGAKQEMAIIESKEGGQAILPSELAQTEEVTSVESLQAIIQTANIPNIVIGMISLALYKKASDIHIEAMEENVRIRFRVDGNLSDIAEVPRYFRNALVSRVKILAQMKIDEQRVPQDGRLDYDFRNHTIDIRVSTFPTVHGEKVVMRLLDKNADVMTLEQLGITGSSFDAVIKAIYRPYGVVMATGPTGSGKSTTLYAILKRIAKPNTNVVTLEDPVEYEISGVNQSQVKPGIGYTFAEGLRSVLRQDPNIIMVGEVRDLETASMVTHAALTGHLVLTTLHTNDASSALPRLVNMGVEPYLITSSITAIIAQRLVRKLCVACRVQIQLPQAMIDQIHAELSLLKGFPITNEGNYVFYDARGCGECNDGYSGRIGIYEVLSMSDTIESLAVNRQPSNVIAQAAINEGMITLRQDGILKALKGITTIDEVWRVTSQL